VPARESPEDRSHPAERGSLSLPFGAYIEGLHSFCSFGQCRTGSEVEGEGRSAAEGEEGHPLDSARHYSIRHAEKVAGLLRLTFGPGQKKTEKWSKTLDRGPGAPVS